ncbi:hypothetical protein PTKU46_82490 [Paraburkholderia terrae]
MFTYPVRDRASKPQLTTGITIALWWQMSPRFTTGVPPYVKRQTSGASLPGPPVEARADRSFGGADFIVTHTLQQQGLPCRPICCGADVRHTYRHESTVTPAPFKDAFGNQFVVGFDHTVSRHEQVSGKFAACR